MSVKNQASWFRLESGSPRGRLTRVCAIGAAVIAAALAIRAVYRPPHVPTAQELEETRIRTLEAAIERSPGDLNGRWMLARGLSATGHTDEYIEQLKQILKLDPGSDEARTLLASAYLARKDGKSAEPLFRAILTRSPRSASAQNGLTLCYLYERRARKALESAQRALQLAPAEPLYQFALGWAAMQRANTTRDVSQQQKYYALAVEQFEKVATVWRTYPNLRYYLGSCYANLQNNNLAIRNLEMAVTQMPGDPRPVILLARAYKARADHDRALALVRQYVTQNPENAEAQDLLGELLSTSVKPEDQQEMIRACEAAARLAPKEAAYCLHLGSGYLREGNLKEAALAFSEAARLDPNDPAPFQQLAAVYTRLGDNDRATSAADIANKLVYNQKLLQELEVRAQLHPREIPTHLMLADRYLEMGVGSAAEDHYEAVLQADSKNARALAGLKKARAASSGAVN